jgi:hypothetical protein
MTAILNDPRSFLVDVVGSSTGRKYNGLFRVKPFLSHRDKLRRDEIKRQLIGSLPDGTSNAASQIAEIFGKIWAHLVEAPSWWKDAGNGIDLIDEEPVVAVIEELTRIEKEAQKSITESGDQAKTDLQNLAKKE